MLLWRCGNNGAWQWLLALYVNRLIYLHYWISVITDIMLNTARQIRCCSPNSYLLCIRHILCTLFRQMWKTTQKILYTFSANVENNAENCSRCAKHMKLLLVLLLLCLPIVIAFVIVTWKNVQKQEWSANPHASWLFCRHDGPVYSGFHLKQMIISYSSFISVSSVKVLLEKYIVLICGCLCCFLPTCW